MHFFHKRITSLCIFLLLYTATFVIPEGFAPGTPVHTPTGFTAIENLEPGHEVVSFDLLKLMIYINNIPIKVTGRVVDGMMYIGSAWIPREFL